jgi:predicted glycosyltransferase
MEESLQAEWLDTERETLETKADGKTLINLTSYDSIALWWFIRFRFFHRVRTTSLVRSLTKNALVFSLADFVYGFSTSFLCRVISRLLEIRPRGKRKTVLITVHDRDWRTIDMADGSRGKRDLFFDSIIRDLQKRGFRIVTVTPLKADLRSGLKTMISRIKHQQRNLIHKEFNSYWSMKVWSLENEAKRTFRKAWREASQNEKLITRLKKVGWQDELPYYFDNIFSYVAESIEMAKKLIEEQSPDFILVTSEHGIIQKSIMVAGRLSKIPTMALQHGTIGQIHKGYLSWKSSISTAGDVRSPFCPIPDKTALFGPYYFDLLTKAGAYPLESVVVTGEPRYDALIKASQTYDRDAFYRKFGLDPNKKLILVLTEAVPIQDGKLFLKCVLKALKDLSGIEIVVKPHPAEVGEWYNDVLKEENVKATILSKRADTNEVLYVCNLLVASFSTVVIEATILGKLSVTAYLAKASDPTPYFKEVSLRVYKEEDISPAIRKALYDDKTREALKRAGAKFVFEHAYKMDGKATERVTAIIEEMTGKKP